MLFFPISLKNNLFLSAPPIFVHPRIQGSNLSNFSMGEIENKTLVRGLKLKIKHWSEDWGWIRRADWWQVLSKREEGNKTQISKSKKKIIFSIFSLSFWPQWIFDTTLGNRDIAICDGFWLRFTAHRVYLIGQLTFFAFGFLFVNKHVQKTQHWV